jgi:hypothetical protein
VGANLPTLYCGECVKEGIPDDASQIIGKGVLVSPIQDEDHPDTEDTEHFLFHMNCYLQWFSAIMQEEDRMYQYEISIAPIGQIAAGLFTVSDDEL